MARPTAIDRAILVLDGEIAVLQLAKAKLQQQQGRAPRKGDPALSVLVARVKYEPKSAITESTNG